MSSKCYVKYFGKIPNFIIYMILEWTMIFILFIDGIVSFLSNEIARLFGLEIPCLLCTRFDHFLLPRNKNYYYNDSICEKHKKNISALAYCTTHKKLSNIKNMCESCLISFASDKHSDPDNFVEDGNKKSGNREENVQPQKGVNGGEKCVCCGETIKPKTKPKLAKNNSVKSSFLSQSPRGSPRARLLKTEGGSDLANIRMSNLKFGSTNREAKTPPDDIATAGREDNKGVGAAAPVNQYSEDPSETPRTPMSRKANRIFGISFPDSANTTPRFRFSENLSLDDKVELVPEPSDADASLNEADGDHIINKLKKEVRLDRRSLIELYMELDEERNASAVAANNAMAMISRLQAEKAAVQMEALQYQRMMEEQAEYDQEAVQVMKEIVEKREEEIDLLECELESYREKYGYLKTVDSELCEVEADEYQDMKLQSSSPDNDTSIPGSPKESSRKGENRHHSKDSVESGIETKDALALDFESERSYLLGLLQNLEKKVEPPSEESSSSSPDKEAEDKAALTREMSTIRERLKALEAESGFLRHAAMTIQKGSEGTKLLAEIAEHLRKLRN